MRPRTGILIFILLVSLVFPLMLVPETEGQSVYVDFKTFLDDYNETAGIFESYSIDEEVTIEDEIEYIMYDEEDDITTIWFESTGISSNRPQNLVFHSDLTSDFKNGEKIEVTFTIYSNETGVVHYDYTNQDIDHITTIKEKREKHGIDILGFHVEFPESLKILDNNIGRFIVQFVIWVLIGIIVLLILDPMVKSLTKRTKTKIDDLVLEIIRKPVLILIILYGMITALIELELPRNFMYYINGAYSVGFYLVMVWIGYKIFQGVLIQVAHIFNKRKNYQVSKILVPAVKKLGTIIIGFAALSAILGFLKIDLTLFVAGGVVISMVIAFAAQDTLSNFFAGMFLILEPKFKEGDMIYFEGDTFVVRKIGMRTTELYDLFKHLIVVMPNNKLANEKLINITEPDRRIKDSCEVGVAYGSDPQKVQDILFEIASEHPDIINDDPDRKPYTRFSKFGESSIDFKVGFWVRDLDDRFRVQSEVNQAIYYRLEKEGIAIPFPQRDLHIIEPKGNNIGIKTKKSIGRKSRELKKRNNVKSKVRRLKNKK